MCESVCERESVRERECERKRVCERESHLVDSIDDLVDSITLAAPVRPFTKEIWVQEINNYRHLGTLTSSYIYLSIFNIGHERMSNIHHLH